MNKKTRGKCLIIQVEDKELDAGYTADSKTLSKLFGDFHFEIVYPAKDEKGRWIRLPMVLLVLVNS